MAIHGFRDGTARVRVPATSANLGPGFDALGLALTLHDEVAATVTDGGIEIDIEGHGADRRSGVPRDHTHLVIRSMLAAFALMGVQPPGLALACTNRIPHGRGLGSSAAAIVAGVSLAGALWDGRQPEGASPVSSGDLLMAACTIEGHPDNVVPCAMGGFTIACQDGAAVHAARRRPDPRIVPVAFVPPFTASTELARGLLPVTVPHADAAFNAGRSALLVAALLGDAGLLFDATEDRLHQPFRAPAMAESWQLVTALRARRHAAVISGAGPTVLVLAASPAEAEALEAFTPDGWERLVLGVDEDGAQVLEA